MKDNECRELEARERHLEGKPVPWLKPRADPVQIDGARAGVV